MKAKEFRIALCGGGTGGHVMPALNIYAELKARNSYMKFRYIGTKDSLEERLANTAGIEFSKVWITYLRRHFSLRNIGLPFMAAVAVSQALYHLLKHRIDFVIGTGGFSALPTLAASSLIRIPYVLQEQNNLPGLTTRLTAKRAVRIYLGHARAIKHLKISKNKIRVTGNPVSWNINPISQAEARKSFGLNTLRSTIFVSGGSGGAASINLVINALKTELTRSGYNLIWQTGKHWDTLAFNHEEDLANLFADRFFSQEMMFQAYCAADLAIVRCGEMTLAELAMAGLPAILIPFPYSAEGHQEANGRAVEADGGGVMILDSELTTEKLSSTISAVLTPDRHELMKAAMKGRSRPYAVSIIADDILEILA